MSPISTLPTRSTLSPLEGSVALSERFLSSSGEMNLLPCLTPANTVFVILSFEGPDPYSMAGGLGRRVTELSAALSTGGYETHLFFVGDPERASQETHFHGKLSYHRWSGWLSKHFPNGVYHGEQAKREDMERSLPEYVVNQVVRPAVSWGKRVVILSEEWHTATTACNISDALHHAGLREQTLMLWNANNTMGFEEIDWARLRFTQDITTVSHWMKHVMWQYGVNPLVIPNGIPSRLLEETPLVGDLCDRIAAGLWHRVLLTKVARFDPDKRWLMAVEAVAALKRRGLPVLLVGRGGMEAHGGDVLHWAHELGLRVVDVHADNRNPGAAVDAVLHAAAHADYVNLKFHMTDPILQSFYRASDAVLANSGREPFGLVGLEVMASGGVAFTGATGEEYARPFENAVVLETDDAVEIEVAVQDLLSQPKHAQTMRENARRTAAKFTWESAIDVLLRRCQFLGYAQGWTEGVKR